MTLVLKDPASVLDYAIDWGAQYLDPTDMLAESSWSVVPVEDGGVAIVSSDISDRVSTVNVQGGVPGRIYRLFNRVVAQSGRIDERSVVLRVEQR
jgi:hypothetical protein